jgi:hypothetical protein
VGPGGVWKTQGSDYATDSELLHRTGYAEFYLGGGGTWYPAHGTHGYLKQSVVPRPKNYAQDELRTYLKKHSDILSPDATPYLEMNTTLEEAFKIADMDPLITHFIVMQTDNYFNLTFWKNKRVSKDTIVFFHEVMPSWLNTNYSGGIWIYSKKIN